MVHLRIRTGSRGGGGQEGETKREALLTARVPLPALLPLQQPSMAPPARVERLARHLAPARRPAPSSSSGGGAQLTAERLQAVVDWSHGLVDSGELPFGAVLVAHRGQVALADAYGPARPLQEPDAPLQHGTADSDTLYRTYSMTKPMAAALAMVLVDEGKMALADPLSKHLPASANLPPGLYSVVR